MFAENILFRTFLKTLKSKVNLNVTLYVPCPSK